MSKSKEEIPRELYLVRDVLDKQLIDRNGHRMGRVDGIVLELRADAPPQVLRMESGMDVLTRRIHPRLGRWFKSIAQRCGLRRGRPLRIGWSKVRRVGLDLGLDLDVKRTRAWLWEKWLDQHVVRYLRLPWQKVEE
jgi:sporulation protein YlmC with PRC-barrel domain